MSAATDPKWRIANALRERAGGGGRSPAVVMIDAIWRFFCSTRVAVFEIVFLAILVLIGTLRGSIVPAQLPRIVPAFDPIVRRWYQFDVFHSLIFSLTLALLAIGITVCTINRLPGIWRAIARPTVATTRSFFATAEPAVALRPAETPGCVADEIRRILSARRYRVLTGRRGDHIHIYADKNRFARLGTFPFHLALILVLAGGIVGSEFGFRDMAIRDHGRLDTTGGTRHGPEREVGAVRRHLRPDWLSDLVPIRIGHLRRWAGGEASLHYRESPVDLRQYHVLSGQLWCGGRDPRH